MGRTWSLQSAAQVPLVLNKHCVKFSFLVPDEHVEIKLTCGTGDIVSLFPYK